MERKVEIFRRSVGSDTLKISGFTEKELSELNSMDYREMKDIALRVVSSSGVYKPTALYSAWIRGGELYAETSGEEVRDM